jgi:predicted metal-dependent hydrolase
MTDLTIWEGDGLPDYDDWLWSVEELNLTTPELEGWLKSVKREAWIREKMSKYPSESEKYDNEWQLATCRYFWRRYETLKSYIARWSRELDQQLDREETRHKLRDSRGRFTKGK